MSDSNENGRLPAVPLPFDDRFTGLTKREYIATQILAGLTVSLEGRIDRDAVETAVIWADELLAYMEEE